MVKWVRSEHMGDNTGRVRWKVSAPVSKRVVFV